MTRPAESPHGTVAAAKGLVHENIQWRRRLTESVAIVFSILPAFAIDAGWDRHQQRLEEAELLAGLEEEFESNSALLAHLDALNRRAAIVFGGFPDVLQALGNVRPPNEIGDSRRTAIGREVVVEAA